MRKELEVSPQSLVITQAMAARIHQDGGCFYLTLSQTLETNYVHNRYWISDRLRTRRR